METYGRRGENGEYIRARSTQIPEKLSGENNVTQGGVGAGLQGKLCTCPGVVKGLALAKRVASARATAWKQS